MLGRYLRLALRERFVMLLLVQYTVDEDACCYSQNDADADGQETQSGLRSGEGVRGTLEDVGKCGEEEEEDAESEGGAEGEEEYNGLDSVS
jgi:hypothetical protein